MGKDLITIKRKLNAKHIFLVCIIAIIILVLPIFICNKIRLNKIKAENDKTAEKFYQMQQKIIQEKQEKVEKEKNKFNPLTSEELAKMEKIYSHSDVKRVFLTFDDGPTTTVTPFILDLLKQENIKANFFVLGLKAELNPTLVKREYDEGHFIGNHGYSHKYSQIYSGVDALLDEYNKTNVLIRNATGNPNYNSLVFRFPGGSAGGYYNDMKKEARNKLKEMGIANVDWNALTNDSDGAKTTEKIMKNFYDTVEDKTSVVLLMHDAADKILTYETLPEIIKYFRENGYKFETMYDVIGRE